VLKELRRLIDELNSWGRIYTYHLVRTGFDRGITIGPYGCNHAMAAKQWEEINKLGARSIRIPIILSSCITAGRIWWPRLSPKKDSRSSNYIEK
jgi:hypothetical protein